MAKKKRDLRGDVRRVLKHEDSEKKRDLRGDVRRVLKHEDSESLIPAAFLVFGLLDAIPIPTDVGFFYVQRWLTENRDRLTPKQRWWIQYVNYYGWDMIWYLTLFGITYYGGNGIRKKLMIGGGFISVGAIATFAWKSMKELPPVPPCDPVPEQPAETAA